MSTAATITTEPASGWLRSVRFDINFIVGTTVLAVVTGWVVVLDPRLFAPVLVLDLWLLGQHHVVATFTRLCFTKQDLARYRFLVFYLPVIVFAAALAAGLGIGWWVLGTTYFYWQWFHYTRQSWGISQMYRRQAKGAADENETVSKLAFYLPPLWGILHRSWQAPDEFLGLEFRVLPVSGIVVDIVGAAAIAALAYWIVLRVVAWRRGRIAPAHTFYIASHHIVFFVGYLLIEDVTFGWLVINIWHNLQYILFVWLQNNKRFEKGIDATARAMSTLSQSSQVMRYFLVCFGIATLAYLAIQLAGGAIGDVGLPLVVLMYQTLNFHHYIVDGIIWKSKHRQAERTGQPALPTG
jgi:hypothetical protein